MRRPADRSRTTTGRRRRTVVGFAAMGALCGVTAACGLKDGSQLGEASSTTTTASSTSVAPVADAPRYEEGPCPFAEPDDVEVTCGTLTVLRDRARPDEGTVEVAVARLAATSSDPEPDPILYFEGGPGGASLVSVDWWAKHRLLDQRDIILFDQRGTGYSSPNLTCAPEFDDAVASASDFGIYRDCFDRLESKTDVADFTTREAAEDVADLMDVLDLHDVDLLGVSYGTRLAMVTAQVAPERVRSVVLDSVYPPGVEALELEAPNAEGAFEALYVACAEDEDCAAAYPDLESVLHDSIAALDDDPQSIDLIDIETGERNKTAVFGDDLIDGVFEALYDLTVIPDIPRAIALAGTGDRAKVEEAFDLLYDADYYETQNETKATTGEVEDDSDGLYYSVTCSEEMPMTNGADVRAAGGAVDPELREGLLSYAEYDVDVCKVFDAGQATAPPLEPVTSDLPALFLAGSLDPITPPHWASEAAKGFAGGFFYELAGVGHGVMDSHLCGYELVKTFLDDPAHPPDNDCVARAHPPAFHTD